MRPESRSIVPALGLALIFLAGCAASVSPATVIRTAYNPPAERFSNILVVSVTGDYNSRAAFERQLAQEIAGDGAAATAYYTVIGRNPQLTRTHLHNAIRAREFDAVVFTRLQGQEQQELAPMRPTGAAFDLFAHDYAELNRDVGIEQAQAITFVTEAYETATQSKVWAIETLSFDKPSAEALIAEQVSTIADQLQKDRLLRR